MALRLCDGNPGREPLVLLSVQPRSARPVSLVLAAPAQILLFHSLSLIPWQGMGCGAQFHTPSPPRNLLENKTSISDFVSTKNLGCLSGLGLPAGDGVGKD